MRAKCVTIHWSMYTFKEGKALQSAFTYTSASLMLLTSASHTQNIFPSVEPELWKVRSLHSARQKQQFTERREGSDVSLAGELKFPQEPTC